MGDGRPPDELINQVTWKIPNALALIGSRWGDEWNAMTTSWITQVSMDPVLVGIGVDNSSVTHRLISAGGAFSINLWSSADTRTFVKFSKPARRDGLTLNGRAVREGATGVPVFEEAVAWMELKVHSSTDYGTHTFFVGEIVNAGLDPDYDEPVAAISHTRMKYGGVKRSGH